MSGLGLMIAFVIAIIVMIVAISKYKIHPFLSIMTVSLVLGLVAGIPLVDTKVDGKTVQGIATVIGSGFSGTFTSIGIVIILGALIGGILEITELMGWVVSIPVFCDSGFVILNPIRKALVKRTLVPSVGMSVALSAGLYISHVFIPPTPGPIAAANTLGIGNNLLLVIGMGMVVSIFPLIAGYAFVKYIGPKVKTPEDINDGEVVKTYEEIMAAHKNIPGAFSSLAPIIVPILLMALGSVSNMAKWGGFFGELCVFLGTPVIALAVGVIFAIFQLIGAGKTGEFYELTNETLKVTGPILFVTAAGGVLGKVIAVSGMVQFITTNASILETIGIFFPFLLSAILKTAQGSSTVALTTTAGIVAPLLGVLGLDTPMLTTLTVMAIGAGAMVVSHANDSYFWVVTNFGEMTPDQGYKTQTVCTFILGVSAMLGIWLLSLFC